MNRITPTRAIGTVSVLLVVATQLGCGAARTTHTLDMDATVISVDSEDEIIFGDHVDLLAEGNELLRAGEHYQALRRYQLIVTHFPDVSYMRTVAYNMGLCHEGLDDWSSAATRYEQVVQGWPASQDATDALFRWAEANSQRGLYESVVPLMERALGRARLTLFDRIEAHVRWGNATLEMREFAEAEQHYREATRLNDRASRQPPATEDPDDQALPDFHPMLVQAHFGLGRTYHALFLEIKLVLPEGAIRQALVDKGQLLEQARQSYLEAVRAGHPYWSPAAGFMVGQIYEDFYLDILACEVPHHFDGPTLEVYFDELRDYLRPLVERAMNVYEDNLGMAGRMRSDNVWVEETQLGIRRIERYLYDDQFQSDQEQLILEQQHPHSAQDPGLRWVAPQSVPDV